MEFGNDRGQDWGDYQGINNDGWNPPVEVVSYGGDYNNGGDYGGGYDSGGGGDYGGGGDGGGGGSD